MGERLMFHLATLDTVKVSSGDSLWWADTKFDADGNRLIDEKARVQVDEWEKANLISSLCDDGMHKPVIDVDHMTSWCAVAHIIDASREVNGIRVVAEQIEIVPSSTPGHCHVYVNRPMRWFAYSRLLRELHKRGVIEPGYLEASLAREQTFVRRPGVYKPSKVAA